MPSKTFYPIFWKKVFRIFAKSALFRFCLKLLFKKLNVLNALKEPVPVFQFALGAALFNFIFHLVRRFYTLKRKAMQVESQETQVRSPVRRAMIS